MIINPFYILIITLVIAFALVGNSFYTLTIQGLEIDPDEDKEEVLMKQIENSVREWFAYHKYDNKDKDQKDVKSQNDTKKSNRKHSIMSKRTQNKF